MSHRSSGLYKALVVVLAIPFLLFSELANADKEESKKIFSQRCTACHTFGKGVKVGPDLRGVTERRQRGWLVKFIRSSQAVIASGDPIAVELFAQFKGQQMPDWTDLSEQQVGALLDWLAEGGPERLDGDSRSATTATAAEIERGRQLFWGEAEMAAGGVACAGCHAVARREGVAGARREGVGGALGPDLTESYPAYGDGAMARKLEQPCVARWPETVAMASDAAGATAAGFLSEQEAFALRAYLRSVAAKGAAGAKAKGAAAARVTRVAAGSGPAVMRASSPLAGRALGFRWLPYAALVMCMVGLALRYAAARRRRAQLAQEASAAWRELAAGTLWRIGLAGTVASHLLLVAAPQLVTAWGAAAWRLWIFEGASAALGLLALAGWAQVARRQVQRGALLEVLIWGLVGCALLSGLMLAGMHRWASLWSAATVTPYLRSLPSLSPMAGLVEQLPLLVRAHVISWFLLIAAFPLGRSAALAVLALDRLDAAVARPLLAGRRQLRALAARLSPARWLWPEED